MVIIGNRVDCSRNYISRALEARNAAFIRSEIRAQATTGANYIAVGGDGQSMGSVRDLIWMVEQSQAVSDRPLFIKLPDPAWLESVISLVEKAPIICLPLEEEDQIINKISKVLGNISGLSVAVKPVGEGGDLRSWWRGKITPFIDQITASGWPVRSLYIRPRMAPLSAGRSDFHGAMEVLRAVGRFHPDLNSLCDPGEISRGQENRDRINQAFIAASVPLGLKAILMDPTDNDLAAMLKAAMILSGHPFGPEPRPPLLPPATA